MKTGFNFRLKLLSLALASLLLQLLGTGCAGPQLALTNPKLRLTGDFERPLEWEVTVVNEGKRGPFSLCRAGAAKAYITVDAFLVRVGPFPSRVRLHGFVIADGGDPTLDMPDGLEPGERRTVSFEPINVPSLSLFQNIEFKVTSREPSQEGAGVPKTNSMCHRWNVTRTESIEALLAVP
jgi:hypothetical protein